MKDQEIFYFPKGIPGFEECKKFKLMRVADSFLAQLIHAENDGIGFILMPPEVFFKDYSFEVDTEGENILRKSPTEDKLPLEVWTILTNNSDVNQITVNLRAPILLNLQDKIGFQLILNDEKYLSKQPLPLIKADQKGAGK